LPPAFGKRVGKFFGGVEAGDRREDVNRKKKPQKKVG